MEFGRNLKGQGVSVLIKPVSGRCNLRCEYCFYLEKQKIYPGKEDSELLREAHSRLFEQLQEVRPKSVSFCWQGGEPTLAGLDFFEYVVGRQEELFRGRIEYSNSIQTNGLLIDERWARFFRKHGFLVGLSLDGPKEYHDSFRRYASGDGSYDAVQRAVRYFRGYGVEYNILAVVSQSNVGHPREVYRYFVENGFYYLQFIPCVERDETGRILPFSVRPEEYGDFLCGVFDEWIADGYPRVYVRDFEALLQQYIGLKPEVCTFQERCGGYFLMERNGDIYSCDFFVLPEWRLGNILESPLEDILKCELALNFREAKVGVDPNCRVCRWFSLCRGGCYRYWFDESGGEAKRTYFCGAYKRFFQHTEERCLAIAQEFLVSRKRNLKPVSAKQSLAVGGSTPQRASPSGRGGSRVIRRNDPCPCGSGKKWKNCCGKLARSL
ncbi:MAG: anaerobic sulfatase maturase [bacterium]